MSYPPLVLEHRLDLPNKEAFGLLGEQLIERAADGVFCYQDTVAMGLILELLARRIRIPEDVAFVGYDDLPIGNSFSLGLTTYQLDSERVAEESFRVMEDRIQNPSAAPIEVVVPGRLVVRESSSPLEINPRRTSRPPSSRMDGCPESVESSQGKRTKPPRPAY